MVNENSQRVVKKETDRILVTVIRVWIRLVWEHFLVTFIVEIESQISSLKKKELLNETAFVLSRVFISTVRMVFLFLKVVWFLWFTIDSGLVVQRDQIVYDLHKLKVYLGHLGMVVFKKDVKISKILVVMIRNHTLVPYFLIVIYNLCMKEKVYPLVIQRNLKVFRPSDSS